MSYWRWYTNDVGDNSGTDHWKVDVTSDGGQNWSVLEYTNGSQNAWVQKIYLLSNSGIQLTEQVHPESNPIGWLCWHLTRIQDDHISNLAEVEQTWIADNWHSKFKMPA